MHRGSDWSDAGYDPDPLEGRQGARRAVPHRTTRNSDTRLTRLDGRQRRTGLLRDRPLLRQPELPRFVDTVRS